MTNQKAKSIEPVDNEILSHKRRAKKKRYAVKYDCQWTYNSKVFTVTNRYATREDAEKGMEAMQKNNPVAIFGRADYRYNWRIEVD